MTLEHAISSTFVPDQAVTREEVAREVADIESGGAHKDITVEEILLRHHNTTVVHSMLGTLKSLFKEKAREVINPKKEPYKPSSFTESPTALDIRRMNLASNRMQAMR
jgi:tRNA A-37 threonylcarbamoyl transferase component Bud32